MKDIFGQHSVRATRKVKVRFEFVYLEPDCCIAGANNPFNRDLAKATAPEAMNTEVFHFPVKILPFFFPH